MKITDNFTKEEFEKSITAKQLKIDNAVPDEFMDNLYRLAEQLQIIRDTWKAPIIITSGYRSPELNKAVKGAKNSDHKFAAAADIKTKEGDKESIKRLWITITCMVKLGKLNCRQIINEYDNSWIHISVNNNNNSYKTNQILYIK